MTNLYEDDYLIINQNLDKNIFIFSWKEETKNLEIKDFIEKTKLILKYYLECRCSKILGDGTNFLLPIPPKVQEQINNESTQQINETLKKYAHVHSQDFISNMGVEQLFGENTGKTYQERYFGSLDEAYKWLDED